MNPLNATFEDYQAKYNTILPVQVRKALDCVQNKFHRMVVWIDKGLQISDILVKISQVGLTILSFLPGIKDHKPTQGFVNTGEKACKDLKNFNTLVKGSKSVEGFLNFKFKLKVIALNVLGLAISVISALTLIERFNLGDITPIKVALATIPIFGILPWGGLFSFAVVSVTIIALISAVGKHADLKTKNARIQNNKLPFWSGSLDSFKVKEKQYKLQAKVFNLKGEMSAYENLIAKGKRVEADLSQKSKHSKSLFTCQKALEKLNKETKKLKDVLLKAEQKAGKWNLLEKNWNSVSTQEVEKFRQAKESKWKKKLKNEETEKTITKLSIFSNVVAVTRPILSMLSAMLGFGIFTIPFAVNAVFDTFLTGTGIVSFFMKKSAQQIKVSSKDLADYVNLAA